MTCTLCGLECGPRPVADRFCCTGCANVYAILEESGVLASGQDFRETELYRESLKLGLISNRNAAGTSVPIPSDAETRELLFQIDGMWCASCAWLIEHALLRERGVVSADVFFTSDLLKIKYCPRYLPVERISARIAALGYRATLYTGESNREGVARRDLLLRMGVAAFLWVNVMTLSAVLYIGYFEQIADSVSRYLPFVLMALATPAVFYSAHPILRLALAGLRHRAVRMETLLAVGILSAYGSSALAAFRGGRHFYFDTACAIVTLVLIGKLVEQSAKDKASRAVTTLYRLMPKKARLLLDGRERFVSVDALSSGAVFVVRPGERIPADGVVVEGRSHVDESVLTGESVPRTRGPGDAVICGSVNQRGVLQVRATNTGSATTLAQIIRAVELALSSRSDMERQADRVSRVFVPVVIAIALATFAGWTLAGAGAPAALMRAISVLIIACPCALGIATPLALTAAIGAAARRQILISDSRALETVRKVDVVVLDKTGTVTEGDFGVLAAAGDTSVLPLAASLELYSQHPLARALVQWVNPSADLVSNITVHEGAGIEGEVADHRIFAGNLRLCPTPPDATLQAQVDTWERQGHTAIYIGVDGAVRAAVAFGDRIKPEAPAFVAELKRRGIRTLLVSGDARATTEWVAARLGVDEAIAEVLPGQKSEVVERLQRAGATVAMIGDGVNDAPSLAQADLGIALRSGADIAMRAAPVVITSGRLDPVLDVFDWAGRTVRIVRQNLFWAFLYNTAGISLAVSGVLHPIFAAGAMVLSSLSVIWNASRLSRTPALQASHETPQRNFTLAFRIKR
jgi:heavy metal translocating P-type ATPase